MMLFASGQRAILQIAPIRRGDIVIVTIVKTLGCPVPMDVRLSIRSHAHVFRVL